MSIIGITGRSGSGKSTVANILKEQGAVILDADEIARIVVGKGTDGIKEVSDYFGESVINSDGELDRNKIADIVFSDNEKLKKLNDIVHHRVKDIFEKRIEMSEKNDILVFDVPLPVENGVLGKCDEVWVIISNEKTRLGRLSKRSGWTHEHATKRLESQPTDAEYMEIADKIIYNNGDIEELRESVLRLYKEFIGVEV